KPAAGPETTAALAAFVTRPQAGGSNRRGGPDRTPLGAPSQVTVRRPIRRPVRQPCLPARRQSPSRQLVRPDGDGNRKPMPLDDLLARIRACRRCEAHLPLGPRPVLVARPSARILVVGQAPGTKVHETGIPWNDRSGDRLRDWLGV